MSLGKFLQEVERGLPSPVYLFCVDDAFLHTEALEAIKGLVPPAERDFNLHVFEFPGVDSQDPNFAGILDIAGTVSFFGGRRFTICSANLQKLPKKDYEKLQSYAAAPPDGSVLVIFHDGPLKKEIREKFSFLKPLGLNIREMEIPVWLKERASRRGLKISDEVCDYLIALVGPEAGLLAAEIEKISLLGKECVNPKDISAIVSCGRLYGIFDLINALKQKDPDRVFRIYNSLRETAEDYGLLGALNWQYAREVHSTASEKEKEKSLKLFELLNAADIEIKSSGRNFPMEYLLLRLLRLQEPQPGMKGRLPS